MIFVNKNWPNDPRRGCQSPSNLIDFLEKDINVEKELEEFEGDFERDEVVEAWKSSKYIVSYILENYL